MPYRLVKSKDIDGVAGRNPPDPIYDLVSSLVDETMDNQRRISIIRAYLINLLDILLQPKLLLVGEGERWRIQLNNYFGPHESLTNLTGLFAKALAENQPDERILRLFEQWLKQYKDFLGKKISEDRLQRSGRGDEAFLTLLIENVALYQAYRQICQAHFDKNAVMFLRHIIVGEMPPAEIDGAYIKRFYDFQAALSLDLTSTTYCHVFELLVQQVAAGRNPKLMHILWSSARYYHTPAEGFSFLGLFSPPKEPEKTPLPHVHMLIAVYELEEQRYQQDIGSSTIRGQMASAVAENYFTVAEKVGIHVEYVKLFEWILDNYSQGKPIAPIFVQKLIDYYLKQLGKIPNLKSKYEYQASERHIIGDKKYYSLIIPALLVARLYRYKEKQSGRYATQIARSFVNIVYALSHNPKALMKFKLSVWQDYQEVICVQNRYLGSTYQGYNIPLPTQRGSQGFSFAESGKAKWKPDGVRSPDNALPLMKHHIQHQDSFHDRFGDHIHGLLSFLSPFMFLKPREEYTLFKLVYWHGLYVERWDQHNRIVYGEDDVRLYGFESSQCYLYNFNHFELMQWLEIFKITSDNGHRYSVVGFLWLLRQLVATHSFTKVSKPWSGKEEISAQQVIRALLEQIQSYEPSYGLGRGSDEMAPPVEKIDSALLQYVLLLSVAYYLSPRSVMETRLNTLISRLITHICHSYKISREAFEGESVLTSAVVIAEDKTPFDIAKIMIQQSFALLDEKMKSAGLDCGMDLREKADALIQLLNEVVQECNALPQTAKAYIDNLPSATRAPAISVELLAPSAMAATAVATSSTGPAPASLGQLRDGILYPQDVSSSHHSQAASSSGASSSVPVSPEGSAVSSSSPVSVGSAVSSSSRDPVDSSGALAEDSDSLLPLYHRKASSGIDSNLPGPGAESLFDFFRNLFRHSGASALYPELEQLPHVDRSTAASSSASTSTPVASSPSLSKTSPQPPEASVTSHPGFFSSEGKSSSSLPVGTSGLHHREDMPVTPGDPGGVLGQLPITITSSSSAQVDPEAILLQLPEIPTTPIPTAITAPPPASTDSTGESPVSVLGMLASP